jgi:5-methylcytosine-specific restriction endonuclease McrA
MTKKQAALPFPFPEDESETGSLADELGRARTKRAEENRHEIKTDWRRCFERQRGFCAKCRKHWTVTGWPEIDHIQALINGGTNALSNKQLLCEHCHELKTSEDIAIARRRHRLP